MVVAMVTSEGRLPINQIIRERGVLWRLTVLLSAHVHADRETVRLTHPDTHTHTQVFSSNSSASQLFYTFDVNISNNLYFSHEFNFRRLVFPTLLIVVQLQVEPGT